MITTKMRVTPFDLRDPYEERAQQARSEFPRCEECGKVTDVEYRSGEYAGWWKVYCPDVDNCGWFVEIDAE